MSVEPIPSPELESFVRDSCRNVAIAILGAMRIADKTPDEVDAILDQKKGTTRRQINRLINGDGSKIGLKVLGHVSYATGVAFRFSLVPITSTTDMDESNAK